MTWRSGFELIPDHLVEPEPVKKFFCDHCGNSTFELYFLELDHDTITVCSQCGRQHTT